jgi:hypothetical protein
MKPGRVNLTLILLIGLIGSLIYLADHRRTAEGDGTASDSALLAMSPNEVDFLRLEFGDQIIELKQEAGEWQVVLPFRDRASDALISGILESWGVLSTSILEDMNSPEDVAAVGLNPPEKVIVVGSKTARMSISVGKSLPLEEGTYIQRAESEGIQIAQGDPFQFIPETLDAFRQKVLFSGLAENVKRFEIRGGERSFQCVREDSGDWRILQPFNGRGDSVSIQNFIENLYQLNVTRFVADQVSDPGIYSIDERSPEIRLYFKREAEADILQIGSAAKESGEVYASDPSRASVFTVSENVIELLETDVVLFRDHRPVPYAPQNVQGVRIRYEESEIQLEQSGLDEWRVRSPEPRPASKNRVAAFLDLWTSPVIREFVTADAKTNLAQNATRVGEVEFITGTGEGETERSWFIHLYESAQPGQRLIYLVQDDTWAIIPSALLEARAAQPLAFYSLQILAAEKKNTVGYTLESSVATQKVFKGEAGVV